MVVPAVATWPQAVVKIADIASMMAVALFVVFLLFGRQPSCEPHPSCEPQPCALTPPKTDQEYLRAIYERGSPTALLGLSIATTVLVGCNFATLFTYGFLKLVKKINPVEYARRMRRTRIE